jgi:ATP-dependent RNA helicase RhlE
MNQFEQLNLNKPLRNAIIDLGFETPTPIQAETFSKIMSGKDLVGIAQTGTGKTLAYMLPLLQLLKFSKETPPRILVLVPTRELVLQVVEQTKSYAKYMNVRVLGVYGGANINVQKQNVAQGVDILVATPGRLYDLALSGVLQLKSVKKLVIDEVDIMLDLGFRYQLTNIFELLPQKRQNVMFSATMTAEVDALIDDYFTVPEKVSIAVSGTPLENIEQQCFQVPNFNTKVNLLSHLIKNKKEFAKVLVFVSTKKFADKVFEKLEETFASDLGILHANKSQNFRIKAIQKFEEGKSRIVITTEVMARGLDLENITHVINFDTPQYPENYMHRIGRTGRMEQKGNTILFYTEKEAGAKKDIEKLMNYTIPQIEIPEEVEISTELIEEERPPKKEVVVTRKKKTIEKGEAFHEKKLKNTKYNQGGSYLRKKKTYKKPITKGDKIANRKNKNRK